MNTEKRCYCKEPKEMELLIAYLAWRVGQPESVIRKIYNQIKNESAVHKA